MSTNYKHLNEQECIDLVKQNSYVIKHLTEVQRTPEVYIADVQYK